MSKNVNKRNKSARHATNAVRALNAKRERQDRHAAMMARHAEHRAAVEAWQLAYERWLDSQIGPRPIHPDYVVGIVARVNDDDDLMRAADELGIDLSN